MLTNVILDIDETLVSTLAMEEEFPWDDPVRRQKLAKNYVFHNMENYYIVFERPHLQSFLDYLFKNFTVSVWSAGSKDYVSFIIDKIILQNPDRQLDYVFWSYHCKESKKHFKKTKNLKLLWNVYKLPEYNKKNTVIIDDLDETWKTQKLNCIKADEFNVLELKKDRYLIDLQKELTAKRKL